MKKWILIMTVTAAGFAVAKPSALELTAQAVKAPRLLT